MAKTIVIVGFGPGISTAIARKFGAEGFSVALVSRDEQRLAVGVRTLSADGIAAAAFPADAGDINAIQNAIRKARAEFGCITVIHWNAYGGMECGDLTTSDPAGVKVVFDVAIVGLLAAVQEALPDLRANDAGAILVTNGWLGDLNPQMDEYATKQNSMGVALANAAKHKLVGLLAQRLKRDGVFVGEIIVAGTIRGTPWDSGGAIEGSVVANEFWELYQARETIRARVS